MGDLSKETVRYSPFADGYDSSTSLLTLSVLHVTLVDPFCSFVLKSISFNLGHFNSLNVSFSYFLNRINPKLLMPWLFAYPYTPDKNSLFAGMLIIEVNLSAVLFFEIKDLLPASKVCP